MRADVDIGTTIVAGRRREIAAVAQASPALPPDEQ
jgi:hypothetical protein